MTRKERLAEIIKIFEKTAEKPATELEYQDPYELVVAVVLSAQCTDKRVNLITPAFFEQFPTSRALAKTTQEEIFALIKSCSYPNNKTKNLLGMARMLEADFDGKVPADIDELQKLPGVGRKTANVVAAVAFGQSTMPVDTHVFRVSQRMGLVKPSKTPRQVEDQLVAICPPEKVPDLHHWLILHGRYVCKARRPLCGECIVYPACGFKGKKAV